MSATETRPPRAPVVVEASQRPAMRPPLPDGTPRGLEYRVMMDDVPGAPVVQLTYYDPHWTEPRHRHLEDEILLLFDGELTIGEAVYSSPAAVYVPRGVLYGPLIAGETGAKFFRIPYNEGTFIPPHQRGGMEHG